MLFGRKAAEIEAGDVDGRGMNRCPIGGEPIADGAVDCVGNVDSVL